MFPFFLSDTWNAATAGSVVTKCWETKFFRVLPGKQKFPGKITLLYAAIAVLHIPERREFCLLSLPLSVTISAATLISSSGLVGSPFLVCISNLSQKNKVLSGIQVCVAGKAELPLSSPAPMKIAQSLICLQLKEPPVQGETSVCNSDSSALPVIVHTLHPVSKWL